MVGNPKSVGRPENGKNIKCVNCGYKFYVKKSQVGKRKYCSKKCQSEYAIKKGLRKTGFYIKCKFCSKNIYLQKKQSRKFCNKECYRQWQLTGDNSLRLRKSIVCELCGKKVNDIYNYLNQRFCSRSCANSYTSKKDEKNKLKVERECLYCHKRYRVWNYRKNETKFCSKFCWDQYRNEVIVCPTCKNEVSFPKNEKRKYCSEACAMKGMDKRKSKFAVSVGGFLNREYKGRLDSEICVRGEGYKYFLDYIIDNYINIECDGTYWHCDPDKYRYDYFHSRIKKTAQEIWDNDDLRDYNLKKEGYRVIRLKEADWNNNSQDFFKKLKEKVDEVSKNKVNK